MLFNFELIHNFNKLEVMKLFLHNFNVSLVVFKRSAKHFRFKVGIISYIFKRLYLLQKNSWLIPIFLIAVVK